MKNIYTILFFLLSLLSNQSANAQCSAIIEDTLVMSTGLYLVGKPTAGVPPFTYNWTVNGSANGPITPIQANSTNDSILIGINDLFANYGCLYISLCISDSSGCTNCVLDTAFTDAIICFSGFQSNSISPGTSQIILPNPVPEVVGVSIATWEKDGQPQSTPVINGNAIITYNPASYNPNGYKIPICVQTFFFNSPNTSCFYCDSVYISPITPSGLIVTDLTATYSILQNPVQDEIVVLLNSFTSTKVELFDTNGRLVNSEYNNNEKVKLDVTGLPRGMYYLRISQSDFLYTEKIVKL